MEKIFTTSEAGGILSVKRHCLLRLIKNNKLCAFKIGKQYRITKEAIEEYIEENSNKKRK